MKIKELIARLENLNPEKEIFFRSYHPEHKNDNFIDFHINDVRITNTGKLVISNACGVD